MELIDLQNIAIQSDENINLCPIIEKTKNSIQFAVDEGLAQPTTHLEQEDYDDVICQALCKEQIAEPLHNIIAKSLDNEKLTYLGKDTMYKCFVQCFAEHRPLVISPEMIWILICQTIAQHIQQHAELYRDKFVSFEGKAVLKVKSETDLLDENNKTDWTRILENFGNQINAKTSTTLATDMCCDFSTTTPTERIASIATLMGAVKSYFTYQVHHMICGIPNVTLLGKASDWESVLKKLSILKTINLDYWYEWLNPIISEFIRTSKGLPNLCFWKNIVLKARPADFSLGRGCLPDFHDVDGWCVALFPFIDNKKRSLSKSYNSECMENEMMRVGFDYVLDFLTGDSITTPMELWSGFIGVEERQSDYALIPKIGWFVRVAHNKEEEINRLVEQDKYRGIKLTIDSEVPIILKELEHIESLTLEFTNGIRLPEWFSKMDIETLVVIGDISKEDTSTLVNQYPNIRVIPKTNDVPVLEHDTQAIRYKRTLYKSCAVAGIGFHDIEDVWDELYVGAEIALVRDKKNKHDKNAVAVVLADDYDGDPDDFDFDFILGYIPRTENKHIAMMLDMGWSDIFECEISELNEHCAYSDRLHINIYIRSKEEQEEQNIDQLRAFVIDETTYNNIASDLMKKGNTYFRWGGFPPWEHNLPTTGENIVFIHRKDAESVLYLMHLIAVGEGAYPFVEDKTELDMDDDCTHYVFTNVKGPIIMKHQDLIFLDEENIDDSQPEEYLSPEASDKIKEIFNKIK